MIKKTILLLLVLSFGVLQTAYSDQYFDPTFRPNPFAKETVAPSDLNLRMVIIGKNKNVAVFDGKEVHVGNVIADYTVDKINSDSVVLKSPVGKERIVKLVPSIRKEENANK